jgi:hypothetical protein
VLFYQAAALKLRHVARLGNPQQTIKAENFYRVIVNDDLRARVHPFNFPPFDRDLVKISGPPLNRLFWRASMKIVLIWAKLSPYYEMLNC